MNCTSATLLVTGPDRPARAFLADNLAADGHDVRDAAEFAQAWQLLNSSRFELVLVALANGEQLRRQGIELIRQIRAAARLGVPVSPATAIVVVAPELSELERLRVFDHGADDLITAPYSYPELRARIAALLRRSRGGWAPGRLRIGSLELDVSAQQAWLDGRALTLSAKEYALLTMLASDPTRLFTRAELLGAVWGFAAHDRTRTVDVHLSRLRRKLAHPRERFVINTWGRGYQLVMAVTTVAPVSALPSLPSLELDPVGPRAVDNALPAAA